MVIFIFDNQSLAISVVKLSYIIRVFLGIIVFKNGNVIYKIWKAKFDQTQSFDLG